jgi:hypothetical protein
LAPYYLMGMQPVLSSGPAPMRDWGATLTARRPTDNFPNHARSSKGSQGDAEGLPRKISLPAQLFRCEEVRWLSSHATDQLLDPLIGSGRTLTKKPGPYKFFARDKALRAPPASGFDAVQRPAIESTCNDPFSDARGIGRLLHA